MFRQFTLFSLFQGTDSESSTLLANHLHKPYGTNPLIAIDGIQAEVNAKNFFLDAIQKLTRKMEVLNAIKDKLDNASRLPLMRLVGEYLDNMQFADSLITKIDLTNEDRSAFRKEVLFDPSKLIGDEKIICNNNIFDTYKNLIITMSTPSYLDELPKNRQHAEKLMKAYKDNITTVFAKYTQAIADNRNAYELLMQAHQSETIFSNGRVGGQEPFRLGRL